MPPKVPLHWRKRLLPYASAQRMGFPNPTLPVSYTQTLNADLTFTGPTAPTNTITKGLTGTLSFTGPTNLRKAITKGIAGGLSFIGPTNLKNALARTMTGGLSFTGSTNLRNAITKIMTGGLSFTGAGPQRAVTKTLTAAGLGFVGALAAGKQFFRTNTGALSFSGATSSLTTYGRTLTAALSFVGSGPARRINKLMTGLLDFNNLLLNAGFENGSTNWIQWFHSGQGAAIDTTVSLDGSASGRVGPITNGLCTGWQQTVNLPIGSYIFKAYVQTSGDFAPTGAPGLAVEAGTGTGTNLGTAGETPNITAGMSWTLISHPFAVTTAGTLNFEVVNSYGGTASGTIWFDRTRLIPVLTLNTAIARSMTAGLSFVGSNARAISKGLTAGLGFTGATSRRLVRTFTAALTLSGAMTPRLSAFRTFTATLSFTGAQSRAVRKSLTAGLGFAGSIGRRTKKTLAAALGFLGNLVTHKSQPPVPIPLAMMVSTRDIPISGPATSLGLSPENLAITMPGPDNTETMVGGQPNPLG